MGGAAPTKRVGASFFHMSQHPDCRGLKLTAEPLSGKKHLTALAVEIIQEAGRNLLGGQKERGFAGGEIWP